MRDIHAHVSLMTRLPEPGLSKTRLIPALGPQGAADLQRRMAEHVVRQCRVLAARENVSLEACVTASARDERRTATEAQRWLGLRAVGQGGGGLGERIVRALKRGLETAQVALVLGADCPAVTAQDLRVCIRSATEAGVAIIPAADGGFCAMAVHHTRRDSLPLLLEGINWGTEAVLNQTVERFRLAGITPALGEARSDVDLPEDLPAWESLRRSWYGKPETLAVVVPVLNESASLAALLPRLLAEADEVVVVDGGSTDESTDVARHAGVRVIDSSPGRGLQQNLGAHSTSSDVLLFVHADSMPSQGFRNAAFEVLADPGVLLGAYTFAMDATTPTLRLFERNTNLRARLLQLPYGDQGLFLRRVAYEALGGFPEEPLLEDLILVETAGRAGKVAISPLPLVTSARRWREYGTWRWTALNMLTLARYRGGATPAEIVEWRRGVIRRWRR